MVLLYVPYAGACPVFYAEIFPTRVRALYRYVSGAGDRQQPRAGCLCHHRRNHHPCHLVADPRDRVCATALIGEIGLQN
jgi:hypothetical protein